MRKGVDFSKGEIGKHTTVKLHVMGSVKSTWAVCVKRTDKNLIPLKLYNIEVFSASNEIRVRNEKGEITFYPKNWFAALDVSKTTLHLLEKAI